MNGERFRRNTELLASAALKLEPLLDHLTFVGGCTTALYITDPAAADVRATDDVDAVVDVATVVEYQRFSGKLRKLGFREDTETGLICRWRFENLSLDVVPVNPSILGFGNDWYREAVRNAYRYPLGSSLRIRVTPAPYFLATKFCAFRDRGKGDFMMSHDLEDIIAVVDGRSELLDEVASATPRLQQCIASEITSLLDTAGFLEMLPGMLLDGSRARVMEVEERLLTLARSTR